MNYLGIVLCSIRLKWWQKFIQKVVFGGSIYMSWETICLWYVNVSYTFVRAIISSIT